MKKHKITATLYYVAAILSYISAIINFAGGNSNSMAVIWICLGSTFLCLGISYSKKSKENNDKENKFQSVGNRNFQFIGVASCGVLLLTFTLILLRLVTLWQKNTFCLPDARCFLFVVRIK